MAHEIEFVNGKAQMMYVGETPWHGLGTKLDTPPATVAEALQLAGLDWTVRLEQLQTASGVVVDAFATVRDSDNKVLGTVGAGYRPMQNADAMKFFDPFLATGAAQIDTAGSLRGGARVWMLAKLNRDDSVIVPKADDRVMKYLLLAQGHDGHLSIHVGLTPIRVVCHNTLSAAIPEARNKRHTQRRGSGMFRIRHTSGAAETLTAVQEVVERADREFEKAAEFFKSLAGKQVRSAAKLRAYVDAVFPPAQKDDAEAKDKPEDRMLFSEIEALFQKGRGNDLPGVKGTAWAAYNAVTEYLTWERGRTADARMNNLWLTGGNGAPLRAITAAKDVLLAA
jgi:phage/plasmid-like protein (TIGR03299 family)